MTGPGGGFHHRVCLAVVDLGRDVCDEGAPGVADGGAVANRISAWAAAGRQRHAAVVARGVDSVHVAGPPMDACVAATARDAHGLDTTVVADSTAGVGPGTTEAGRATLAGAGVTATTEELRRG